VHPVEKKASSILNQQQDLTSLLCASKVFNERNEVEHDIASGK
jgi:hypothetical protein